MKLGRLRERNRDKYDENTFVFTYEFSKNNSVLKSKYKISIKNIKTGYLHFLKK